MVLFRSSVGSGRFARLERLVAWQAHVYAYKFLLFFEAWWPRQWPEKT